jgi:hypothetical protein
MHLVFCVLAALVIGVAIGYGFRGLVHREVGATSSELTVYVNRLESAIKADAQTLKNEAMNLATDIRKKI